MPERDDVLLDLVEDAHLVLIGEASHCTRTARWDRGEPPESVSPRRVKGRQ
jgi:hypothetical protein